MLADFWNAADPRFYPAETTLPLCVAGLCRRNKPHNNSLLKAAVMAAFSLPGMCVVWIRAMCVIMAQLTDRSVSV